MNKKVDERRGNMFDYCTYKPQQGPRVLSLPGIDPIWKETETYFKEITI